MLGVLKTQTGARVTFGVLGWSRCCLFRRRRIDSGPVFQWRPIASVLLLATAACGTSSSGYDYEVGAVPRLSFDEVMRVDGSLGSRFVRVVDLEVGPEGLL